MNRWSLSGAVLYRARARAALTLFGGFYRCPATGRIIEGLKGDDKVLCRCGRSNPACPAERTEETGVHIARFLPTATVHEYLAQQDADAAARPRVQPAADRRRRS